MFNIMNNRDLAAELVRIAGLIRKLAGEDGNLTFEEEKSGLDLAKQFRNVSEGYGLAREFTRFRPPEKAMRKFKLLEIVKQSEPQTALTFIDKGWLKPGDPEFKEALREALKENPSYARGYIDQRWLKAEEPEVKQALLDVLKKNVSFATEFTDEGWLKPEDLEFKRALLEGVKGDIFFTTKYLDKGWIKPGDTGVRQTLLGHIKRDPRDAERYIIKFRYVSKGWLTREEVDEAFGR